MESESLIFTGLEIPRDYSCDGEEYILRIPGAGTSMLIDRI